MEYKVWKYFIMLIHLSSAFEIELTGPGLHPKDIVMPARYFFVNFTSFNEDT